MKGKIIILGLSLLILNSCVLKSDYDKLEKEKSELETQLEKVKSELETQLEEIKNELSDVNYKYDQIIEEKKHAELEIIRKERQAEIERNRIPYISDSKAKQYIKDNYSFYEKGTRYRNIQLRRLADNKFIVSLEECKSKMGGCDDNYFWFSKVRTLTVHNNGKYDF